MNNLQPSVFYSPLDFARFGIRTARANMVNNENFEHIMTFCRNENIVLLIARCLTSELKTAQTMEKAGFILMDTLVYYMRNINDTLPPINDAINVRSFLPDDIAFIKSIATKAFKDYKGHYHADDRLPKNLCDEAYADWAFQSCTNPSFADNVIVAEIEGTIKGFLTLKLRTAEIGEGILFGVSPEAQGLGIGKSLMIYALQWFKKQRVGKMIISTQIINFVSQRVWTHLGFGLSHAFYTFHKWFD